MTLQRRLIEARPGLRWRVGRVVTELLYRSAFGSIGAGTVIVRPHKLQGVERIHLGAGCSVFEGAWLASEPDGGELRIGDHTYLGHDVHLHAYDSVTIGSGCVIADGVFVGSSDHDRDDRHRVHGTGPISIGDRVFLGQRSVVLGGVSIGDGATVGAHAVVTRDVAPGQTVVGIPARPVGA
ncbi:acyltransferase [Nocardioides hwasunensis]|uniref:Acyltransferase n=1 Tax=Nocardioides hwasunensis TaxID=397258 RepID=A0ABR8MPN9_9ACTN|nr:acyltransferase [Nocardioides hwasunensis]MBD3917016.1 acyltransferase [Nocardioides hwasunensis]